MSAMTESVNEYGTPVSVLQCTACGHEVTICPPTTIENWGTECTGDTCPSYDIARDVGTFFEALADTDFITRRPTQGVGHEHE